MNCISWTGIVTHQVAKKINDKDDAVELQKFDGRSMLRDSLFETKTGKPKMQKPQ